MNKHLILYKKKRGYVYEQVTIITERVRNTFICLEIAVKPL